MIKQSLETEPPSCVYDAAIVLAKYLHEKHHIALQDSNVVELGSGCGFTGIYIAKHLQAKHVVMTDVDSVVPLLIENIALNEDCAQRVKGMPLFWGNQEHLKAVVDACPGETVEYLVGADVVFDFDNFDGMMDIIETLFNKSGLKKAFFGFTHRFSDVEKWFKEMLSEKGFKLEKDSFASESLQLDDFTILSVSRQ